MEAQRIRATVLGHARRLLRTPYSEGAHPHASDPPIALDCSGFVRLVCAKVGIAEGKLVPGDAPTNAANMYKNLTATSTPMAGDLAFYQSSEGAWHVMVVTEKGGVIGACNVADRVVEYSKARYSPTWRLKGYRGLPV